MVTGAEKEEYIRVAMEKAHHLKDFVTALFEWVKLDAGEQIFHFEVCDLNELSRDIMADWVPLLENHDLSYEIEIPETEYMNGCINAITPVLPKGTGWAFRLPKS